MTSGVRLAAALGVSVVGVALLVGGPAAGSSATKIDAHVLHDTAGGQDASFLIQLSDQADLSAAYAMRDQDARGWYVYRALKRHAARTQAPIRALLEARNASYTPYWAANVIAARGDRSLVEALAARPDVSVIESNDSSRWIEPEAPRRRPSNRTQSSRAWRMVHAPEVWALGYTGQGIVIGNQDTGHALDAQRAQAALPGLERLLGRPQLQLARLDPLGRRHLRRRTARSPATTTRTARTRRERPSVTTAPGTRSASRRARSGSAAGTWTRATAPRRRTRSASSSSWRRRISTIRTRTRPCGRT